MPTTDTTIPCEVCDSPAIGNAKDGHRCTSDACDAQAEFDAINA